MLGENTWGWGYRKSTHSNEGTVGSYSVSPFLYTCCWSTVISLRVVWSLLATCTSLRVVWSPPLLTACTCTYVQHFLCLSVSGVQQNWEYEAEQFDLTRGGESHNGGRNEVRLSNMEWLSGTYSLLLVMQITSIYTHCHRECWVLDFKSLNPLMLKLS